MEQWRPQDLAKGGGTTGSVRVKPPAAGSYGVWGRSPQSPTNFCDFHTKNTHFSAFFFFIEKEHAVSAITIDNAKKFRTYV